MTGTVNSRQSTVGSEACRREDDLRAEPGLVPGGRSASLRRLVLAFSLFGFAFGACECVTPPPPNPDAPVARITAVLRDEGGFDLVLSNLERPVRSIQVDVKLEGAQATEVNAIAGAGSAAADIVEADLNGQGKDDFTVVIADTRRLNLPAGPVARVGTGLDLQKVTLSRALAVDDSGALRDVTVVVP